MHENRVVITGLGVISPVGNDVPTFWKALKEGKSGVGPLTSFDPTAFDSRIAGEVKGFDPSMGNIDFKEARRTAKFVQYALAAAKQAVVSSGLDSYKGNKERFGVLIGSGIGSLYTIEEEHKVFLTKGPSRLSPFLIPMLIVNEASGLVAIKFGYKGPNSCVATACAAGSHATGDAYRTIERGDADVMISGGTESCIVATAVGGFCSLRALSKCNDNPQKASRPFDKERDGFVMSEGAGILVLEELEHAKARGAKIYAELAGYGACSDAYHITAPTEDGEGSARAILVAIRDAGLTPDDIDYVNAHGTSTPLNDKGETQSIKTAFGARAYKMKINSTKSMVGHMLGAAAGIEAIVCIKSIETGIIHPTMNLTNPDPDCDLDYITQGAVQQEINAALSNSLGFGGHNSAIIIIRYKD